MDLQEPAARNAFDSIGVFDSGLGGLTVVRRISDLLPAERLLYVADQAHVPYGDRDLAEVYGFARAISEMLVEAGCKALVMACNISSATALTNVAASYPEVPVLGVILPGARAAAAVSRSGRIGVLATEGTVRSGAYTRAVLSCLPGACVVEQSCPEFVPLVEAGRERSGAMYSAARVYLRPVQEAGVDTVILGCTHYPFLLPVLEELAPELHFVDPAEQTAVALAAALDAAGLRAPRISRAPEHLLITTGDSEQFAAKTSRFLASAAYARFEAADWRDGAVRRIGGTIPAPLPTSAATSHA